MAVRTRTKTRKRTVTAPRPERGPTRNAVVGVELGEEVRWIWTHADSESVVTGHEIVEKTDDGEELGA